MREFFEDSAFLLFLLFVKRAGFTAHAWRRHDLTFAEARLFFVRQLQNELYDRTVEEIELRRRQR